MKKNRVVLFFENWVLPFERPAVIRIEKQMFFSTIDVLYLLHELRAARIRFGLNAAENKGL